MYIFQTTIITLTFYIPKGVYVYYQNILLFKKYQILRNVFIAFYNNI